MGARFLDHLVYQDIKTTEPMLDIHRSFLLDLWGSITGLAPPTTPVDPDIVKVHEMC